jgi:hypothetical protein
MTHDESGVVVDDGAQDGLGGAVVLGEDPGSVHEVADPEVVDVFHLVGLSEVGAFLDWEPCVGFDDPQQGVVVDRRLAQEVFFSEDFIELLHGEVRVGLALDLNDLEKGVVEAPGPSAVGAAFGFEGVEAVFAVLFEPSLHGGDRILSQAVVGKVVLS